MFKLRRTPNTILPTLLFAIGWTGCAAAQPPEAAPGADSNDSDTVPDPLTTDSDTEPFPTDSNDTRPDAGTANRSCHFTYLSQFSSSIPAAYDLNLDHRPRFPKGLRREPPVPYTYIDSDDTDGETAIILPGYTDDMPVFERGQPWTEETRCFELRESAKQLTESDAFALYRRVAEQTTGQTMCTEPGVRTVIGIRGAYPGTFKWNDNAPDRFNDTIVVLWKETDDTVHVREFSGHTDVGAYDFGPDGASFLLPNQRYRYINGYHGSPAYSALIIDAIDYPVMNDTNANGHWDDDRNGRFPPPTGDDYLRTGFGHNIHVGAVNGPLGVARVGNWSAGCQLIPGMANWIVFIRAAWTTTDSPVDYFLVDARDIPSSVWD